MKVKELIKELETMPQDAEVWHLWDGEARTEINVVWLARDGNVITADYDYVCYPTETRPIDAPTEYEEEFWRTKQNPEWVE